MKRELVYLWINKDKNDCFYHQDFNFSPLYRFSFNYDSKILSEQKLDNCNVFKTGNLCNLSAIIGENGTGKTTLLDFITVLSNFPIYDESNKAYKEFHDKKQELKKYIAVFLIDESELKIINLSGEKIYFCNRIIPMHSYEGYNENFVGSISRINFSNTEYNDLINHSEENISGFAINNSELTVMAKKFYRKSLKFNEYILDYDMFYNLQEVILNTRSNRNFQQILDVIYFSHINKKNFDFLGKKITKVKINFNLCESIVEQNFNKTPVSLKIYRILDKLEQELSENNHVNLVVSILVLNLAYELSYCYGFDLCDEDINIGRILDRSEEYVNFNVKNEFQKSYYKNAVEEIRSIKLLFNELTDNLLPVEDPRYRQYCVVTVDDLAGLIYLMAKKDCGSFVLKYLNIHDLNMSSGERALLNLMSRIELLDLISYSADVDYSKLEDNVLLLLDEIDLYIHPDWQKKLISVLIDQVSKLFKGKNVQIILSTHSPIVLSDIPRDHCTYLCRNINGISVEDGRSHNETFAANINSLYKDSFFIEDGIGIGDFAIKKINEAISSLQKESLNEEHKYELGKFINIVGEPILQNRLNALLSEKQKGNLYAERKIINRHERDEIISFLREQQRAIEEQIRLLSGEDDD